MIDEREQQNGVKRSHSYGERGSVDSQPSSARSQDKTHGRKVPVVFFGNEKLATGIPPIEPVIRQAVEAAGFEIEKVVTGKISELGDHSSGLAVLAAYGRIIPQSVLDQFPLGIINVHPSLLPSYRGPTPIEQAILDGVDKTGVSIMRLTAGMDAGPLYKQKSVQLNGTESKEALTSLLQRTGAELLMEVLPLIATNKLKPRQQPHPDRATYSRLLRKEDGNIDWSKPASQLEREIRAFLGWPGSRTVLGDKEVIITKAQVVPDKGKAGSFSVIGRNLVIFCGHDALLVERLKPAGKNEMSASDFISGYRL